jgi:hypothetical protein
MDIKSGLGGVPFRALSSPRLGRREQFTDRILDRALLRFRIDLPILSHLNKR